MIRIKSGVHSSPAIGKCLGMTSSSSERLETRTSWPRHFAARTYPRIAWLQPLSHIRCPTIEMRIGFMKHVWIHAPYFDGILLSGQRLTQPASLLTMETERLRCREKPGESLCKPISGC